MPNGNNGQEQKKPAPHQTEGSGMGEDCPLCHISEETLKILKEKGKEKKP